MIYPHKSKLSKRRKKKPNLLTRQVLNGNSLSPFSPEDECPASCLMSHVSLICFCFLSFLVIAFSGAIIALQLSALSGPIKWISQR